MTDKPVSDEGIDPNKNSTDEHVATEKHGSETEDMTQSDNFDNSKSSIDSTATKDSIDEGVEALNEPTIRREIFINVSMFVAAGVGLGVIVFLYIIRLVGIDFTSGLETLSSVFLIYETYLVLLGLVTTAVTTYVLLAGLVGIESGTQFDTNIHAITAAGVGSAIGAFLLIIILVLAVGGGFAVLNSVAPPAEALTAAGDSDGISSDQDLGSVSDEAEAGGLSALETMGLVLSVVVSGLFLAAIAGVTGGLTAYITRKYTTN